MKILLRGTIRGDDLRSGYYKEISDAIEKLGYTLMDHYMTTFSQHDHYANLEKGGHKNYEDFYTKEIEFLKSSDINVLECSNASLGIGYLVNKSIEFNKPTVILFRDGHTPYLLAGISDDKVILKKVKDGSVLSSLKVALEEAKQVADKRFNFFISPQLLSYLEEVSKQQWITKSTFIRGLIRDHMKKHKNGA